VAEEDGSNSTGVHCRLLLLLVLDAVPHPYPRNSSSMVGGRGASIGYPLKSEEEPPEEVLAETQRRKALHQAKAPLGFVPQGLRGNFYSSWYHYGGGGGCRAAQHSR
jgi:hypothetical protein